MNGEIQITDLVISKLLRQNIEEYRSLFTHVSAAIRLNVSGVIASRGDNIQYVHTDSKHTDPLYRITPAKLISTQNYDMEKYMKCCWTMLKRCCQYLGSIEQCWDLIRSPSIGGTRFIGNGRQTSNMRKQICKRVEY